MIALSPGMLVPRSWWVVRFFARCMARWERALNPERLLKEQRESRLLALIDTLLP